MPQLLPLPVNQRAIATLLTPFYFLFQSKKLLLRLAMLVMSVGTMSGVIGQATVTSDKPDYAPRSNAVFTGAGFQAFEQVQLKVKNLNSPCNTVTTDSSYLPWTVTADANGAFVTNWMVCDCPGDSLRLKAVGLTSARIAYAYFTDGPKVQSVSISNLSGVLCTNTQSVRTYNVNITNGNAAGLTANLCIKGTIPSELNPEFFADASFNQPITSVTFSAKDQTISVVLRLSGTPVSNNSFQFQVRAWDASSPQASCSSTNGDWAEGHSPGSSQLIFTTPAKPSITPNSSDLCPGSSVLLTSSSLQVTNIWYNNDQLILNAATKTLSATMSGSYTTIANNSGCLSPKSDAAIITIGDNLPPAAPPAPAAISYQCIGDVPVAGALTAQDNCSGAITVTGVDALNNSNTCNIIITRTWTFTDASNNSSSVSQTITVKDDIAPNLKAGQSVPTGGTNISACAAPAGPSADDIKALYEDNCGGVVSVTKSGTPTGSSCGWSVTYSYKVEDVCGNFTTVTVSYDGKDQTAPNLKAGQSVPTGGTNISACAAPAGPSADDIKALYEDNCGGVVSVTKSGTPTGNSCGWSVTYSYKVEDVCGNFTTVTVSYDGKDQTAPNLKAGQSVPTGGTNISACAAPAGPSADDIKALYEDNCGGVVSVTKSGTPTGSSCGWSVTYSYKVEDVCGNFTTVTVSYDGKDQTAPNLKAGQSVPTGGTNISACAAPAGPSADDIKALYEDNCGGVVSVTKSGTPTGSSCGWSVTYSYKVEDVCGNFTTVTVSYDGKDQTAPNLKAGQSVPTGGTNISACAAPAGPSADDIKALYEDNCGGVVSVTKSGTPTGSSCGWSVTYSYKVEDVCGNFTTVTVSYDGKDQTAPNLKAGQSVPTGGTNISACAAPAGPSADDIKALYEDNCGGVVSVTKSGTPTGSSCGWSVTYSYKVEDVCGNFTTVTVSYDGKDQTAPNLKAGQSVPTGGTNISACAAPAGPSADDIKALYEDNCGGVVSVTKSGTPTGNSCGWSVTYSYKVEDVCGNFTTVTVSYDGKDQTAPTWSTDAGSLDRTVMCGQLTHLANAQTLSPTATDNCGGIVTYVKTSGVFVSGGTNGAGSYTNTWIAKDPCSNQTIIVFTQTITVLGITVDASASSAPVPYAAGGASATLSAAVTPTVAGVAVKFYLDGVDKGTALTTIQNVNGSPVAIATLPVTGLAVELYQVRAVAGDGCDESIAYLAVYDPNGGFVTGGGWILSPVIPSLQYMQVGGKANFGFNAKYKKGSASVVEGNTEFQFQAGNLNFKSTSHESMSLVIAGAKAVYKGVGTINGMSGYSFMVSGIDGDLKTIKEADKFRIKIWVTSTSETVYDNQDGAADNAEAITALGGGSIVIHEVKKKTANRMEAPALILAPQEFNVKVLGNPSLTSFRLQLQGSNMQEKFTVKVVDINGRLIEVQQNLYAGQVIELGSKYTQGTYFAEVTQGTNRKVVKLVKISRD